MPKICANCKNDYTSGDKYCRFCGAPMGAPMEAPSYNEESFQLIYGPPPVLRTHTCEKCKLSWYTNKSFDDERFCPWCGGPAPVVCEK